MIGLNEANGNKPQGLVERLMKAIASPRYIGVGVISTLTVLGGLGFGSEVFAQQASDVVATPWTGQDGRAIVKLDGKVKKTSRKSASRIRQTQASSPVSVEALGDSNDFQSLPQYDSVELEDPKEYEQEGLNANDPNGLEDLNAASVNADAVAPLSAAEEDDSANAVEEDYADAPAVPAAAPQRSKQVRTYQPGKRLVAADAPSNQGTFSSATDPTPRYSSNPYSRIGQAEYNPRQFYGGGGNISANPYRNAPPAAAYGDSLCGDGCCEGCCGFGGLLQGLELEAGTVGMRSPLDYDDAGNFGTQVALNWTSVRPAAAGLNVQAGVRGTFTDLNGVENVNGFTRDHGRDQLFFTGGLYFRAPACGDGFSGGVVFDSLNERYYRSYSLSQLRAELSYNFAELGEIGFRGAFALDKDWFEFLNMPELNTAIEAQATASSHYALFLRKRFVEGGEIEFHGGATKWGEGFIGGKVEAPLTDCLALRGSADYVFFKDRGGLLTERQEETWNMMGGLVLYIGGTAKNNCSSTKPLFDVADNGSFMQNFLR